MPAPANVNDVVDGADTHAAQALTHPLGGGSDLHVADHTGGVAGAQIVGYLLTEDPTYITNYSGARSMICKIDRDELMQVLVREYLFEQE